MVSFSTRLRKHRSMGFTLIELLIYVTILSSIAVFVMSIFLGLATSYTDLFFSRILNAAGNTALERMVRDIKTADSIVIATSVFGAHPGRLELVPQGGGPPVVFSVVNDALRVSQGVDQGALTTDVGKVVNFTVYHLEGNNAEGVTIVLTLSVVMRDGVTKTETFSTSALVRKTY